MSTNQQTTGNFRGVLSATGGFLLWGIFPLYWKQMQGVSAFELIAHRITWSLLLLLGILLWQKNLQTLRPAFASARSLGLNLLSSLLLAANWTVYVWAVNRGQVLETSLGYFLVPLVNVILGSLVLRERLRPLQWLSIGCAALGVGLMLFRVGHVPWVALALAGTWASYGLLKKKSALGSIAFSPWKRFCCFRWRSPCCSGGTTTGSVRWVGWIPVHKFLS